MKKLKVFLGVAISALFIYILMRNIDYAEIRAALRGINYYVILPAVILQLASYWVRSARWRYILSGIKEIKTKDLLPIISISYMANNLLPLRMGEIVRAYMVGKKSNISSAAAFSTIILERIYDGITLLLFLGITALVFPFPDWVKQIGILTSLLFFGALIFLIGLVSFKQKSLLFLNRCLKVFPKGIAQKVKDISDKFIEGFEVVRNKKVLIPIGIYSIIIWTMEASLFYAIAQAFEFHSAIYLSFFVLVIVNLGIMVPSSPGYIGTFEFFVTRSLNVFGIAKEIALGYALILRVFQYIPITIVGMIFMLIEGLTFSKITKLYRKQ